MDFFKKPITNISSIREKILYLRENNFLDVYEKQLKENEILFRYMPKKINNNKKSFKKNKKDDNPFSILTNVNYN